MTTPHWPDKCMANEVSIAFDVIAVAHVGVPSENFDGDNLIKIECPTHELCPTAAVDEARVNRLR